MLVWIEMGLFTEIALESSLHIQLTVPMCVALFKDMRNTNKTSPN